MPLQGTGVLRSPLKSSPKTKVLGLGDRVARGTNQPISGETARSPLQSIPSRFDV
ncbi:hypothetical protein [Laspinema palackyanum]|uniref:hypothetical protein n=1 Tax=Laspinema palackyanum TaxID=3231601 RepID=UPI00349F391D